MQVAALLKTQSQQAEKEKVLEEESRQQKHEIVKMKTQLGVLTETMSILIKTIQG